MTAFSLSYPWSNVINGMRYTPCTFLVYDRIIFLSFLQSYTFVSHRLSPSYFSCHHHWSLGQVRLRISLRTYFVDIYFLFIRQSVILAAHMLICFRRLFSLFCEPPIWSTVPLRFISVLCPLFCLSFLVIFYYSKLYFPIPFFLVHQQGWIPLNKTRRRNRFERNTFTNCALS